MPHGDRSNRKVDAAYQHNFPSVKIPFNKPGVMGHEFEYMADAVSRNAIAGDGHYTRVASQRLERETGAQKVLLTTSCTHALEMSALLLEIEDGDEVIMPSFTFVSCANAFVLRGARPVFVDVRPDTLNLDERLLQGAITARTRAILVVHYAGVACAMDEIMAIAAAHNVPVIEDNAHGLFGTYKGRKLGSIGLFSTLSFHETKNIICGEGGALLINDAAFNEAAEIIREKGTNRSRFFRGEIDKYTWVQPGSSYLPSDLLAAFLFAQLECSDVIQSRRKTIWERYHRVLGEWAERNGVTRPTVPAACGQAYHLYYLLMPSLESRQQFIAQLREREIFALFHYVPLHLADAAKAFGYRPGDLPVTESASERLVRLPLYNTMSDDEQTAVIEAVESISIAAGVET